MPKIVLVPSGPFSLSNLTSPSEEVLSNNNYQAFFADICELKTTSFFISDTYCISVVYNSKAAQYSSNDVLHIACLVEPVIYGKAILVKRNMISNVTEDFTLKEFQVLFNYIHSKLGNVERFRFDPEDPSIIAIKKSYGIKVKKPVKLAKRSIERRFNGSQEDLDKMHELEMSKAKARKLNSEEEMND